MHIKQKYTTLKSGFKLFNQTIAVTVAYYSLSVGVKTVLNVETLLIEWLAENHFFLFNFCHSKATCKKVHVLCSCDCLSRWIMNMFTSFFCYNRNSFLTTIIVQRYNTRAMTSITSYPERGTILLMYSIVMFCVTSETSCGAAVVSNLKEKWWRWEFWWEDGKAGLYIDRLFVKPLVHNNKNIAMI